MANKFLNDTGLSYFWGKIKNKIASIVSPVEDDIATLASNFYHRIESDGIASASYRKYDHIMVGNKLRQATTSIAIGETIDDSNSRDFDLIAAYPRNQTGASMSFNSLGASNVMVSLDFVCNNTSHARYGHSIALMIRDNGMALFDNTAAQWIWYDH